MSTDRYVFMHDKEKHIPGRVSECREREREAEPEKELAKKSRELWAYVFVERR